VNLGQLTPAEINAQLKSVGLALQIGPFSFRILSDIDLVTQGLINLYQDYPLAKQGKFVDFTVSVCRSTGVRRWFHPQAIFRYDGAVAFAPLPENHAFPLLEWAMNWCISTQAHQYLLLHSAVIEREGCAVIMPAPPGSGKSTLCAGLINRGWRLLSDELALISLTGATITPLGRPVSLKNQSIDVIRKFAPGAVFNFITPDTTKGSVTHLKVPNEQLQRIEEKAQPRWVIFPKYQAGALAELTPRSKANSMLELGRNSFNYMILGLSGFEALSRVVGASDCYDFQYSQLDDAVAVFDDLVARRAR
jgi:HprK-related kinase A